MSSRPHHDTLTDANTLSEMICGYRVPALIYAVAKLGIPDLLLDGAANHTDLARATQVHPEALRRVLRALTVAGLFVESSEGSFRLTKIGQLLRSDAAFSLRTAAIVAGEQHMPTWAALLHTVRTGKPAEDRKVTWPWRATPEDERVALDCRMNRC